MVERFFKAKSFRFHVPKVIQVPKKYKYVCILCMCSMYYVCIVCMYSMHAFYACILRMHLGSLSVKLRG